MSKNFLSSRNVIRTLGGLEKFVSLNNLYRLRKVERVRESNNSMLYFVRHCVVIDLKICQDHAAKEKALQTMSSMSSAQIVSAGSAIHNKMSPALVGPLALHASTPVSYPGAVSPDLGEEIP